MSEAFTPAQLVTLQMLADKGPQARDPLMRAASIGHTTLTRVYESLEYRGLVTEGERIPGNGRTTRLLEITMAGRRALADLERGEYVDTRKVPAPTRNMFQGVYRPAANVYYRNNGNAHIASRGVAC